MTLGGVLPDKRAAKYSESALIRKIVDDVSLFASLVRPHNRDSARDNPFTRPPVQLRQPCILVNVTHCHDS